MISIDRPQKSEFPEIPYADMLRYLGWFKGSLEAASEEMVSQSILKISEVMQPVACYDRFNILKAGDGKVSLDCMEIQSHALCDNLRGCREVYIFAATIGIGVDRLIRKTELTSVADALCYQAAGAAAIESYCNMLNEKLRIRTEAQGLRLVRRYSPGYADFSLEHQRDIFRVLSVTKWTGITLTRGLLMIPSKSVTALIGIKTPDAPDCG